jgi:hypothetical protein
MTKPSLRAGSIYRNRSSLSKEMKGIAEIKNTFRSETGRVYGPEFIELGLKIGEKIYRFLRERFSEELAQGETA